MPKIILFVSTVLLTIFSPVHFAVAGEKSVYDFSWLDKDKEVFVLQNRKFRKAGSPFITIGSGMTLNAPFVDSYYFQGRIGFFFAEEWGVEGIYSKAFGVENEAAKSVRNTGSSGSTPFRRIVESYYGVALLWSPFYGKINTFNSILYVDWTVGGGLGQLTEKNNKKTLRLNDGNQYADESETHMGGFWETSLKFWVSQNWSVNLDVVGFYYQAERANNIDDENIDAFYSNYDLGLSLSYNF
ncbi:MAG: outer membrane beta-barrel domain-containing protein [Bacteriovoracaceae bacterium]|nr:outer membrane beta-barrel domain-containing protein [Bacteriovoracaceae bacterium]